MIWTPRQCDLLAEAFAASGNFPSRRPRSVGAAIFQMRLLRLTILSFALFYLHLAITPDGRPACVAISAWNRREKRRPE